MGGGGNAPSKTTSDTQRRDGRKGPPKGQHWRLFLDRQPLRRDVLLTFCIHICPPPPAPPPEEDEAPWEIQENQLRRVAPNQPTNGWNAGPTYDGAKGPRPPDLSLQLGDFNAILWRKATRMRGRDGQSVAIVIDIGATASRNRPNCRRWRRRLRPEQSLTHLRRAMPIATAAIGPPGRVLGALGPCSPPPFRHTYTHPLFLF